MTVQRPRHLIERAVQTLPITAKPTAIPNRSSSGDRSAAGASAAIEQDAHAPISAPDPVSLATLQRAGVSVAGQRRSREIEEWRVIVANLLRERREAAAQRDQSDQERILDNTLMVTSSRPAEGKTFCALNLAATIGQSRAAEVVLIDLDAKPGALTDLLGLDDRLGLFDLVEQPSLNPLALLVPTELPNLSIMPFGSGRTSHDDVSNSITPPVITALERLARQLPKALLILDTPPCLATGDAAALAPHAAQLALIVEAERTQRAEIESSLGLIDACPAITLILNKTLVQDVGHFAGGDYAYYGKKR